MGRPILPTEYEPPLLIDSDTVKPLEITPEGLEPIPRWRPKLRECAGGVEHIELAQRSRNYARR